jgi:hypothetical protein
MRIALSFAMACIAVLRNGPLQGGDAVGSRSMKFNDKRNSGYIGLMY